MMATTVQVLKMRSPCPKCGFPNGRAVRKSSQDVVRCGQCDAYCYNAPRTETATLEPPAPVEPEKLPARLFDNFEWDDQKRAAKRLVPDAKAQESPATPPQTIGEYIAQQPQRTPPDLTPCTACYVAADLRSLVVHGPAGALGRFCDITFKTPTGEPQTRRAERLTPALLASIREQLTRLEAAGWPTGKKDGWTGKPVMMSVAEIAEVKERWAVLLECETLPSA